MHSYLVGLSQNTTSLSYAGTDLSARILAAVNAVSPGAVTSAVQVATALNSIPDTARNTTPDLLIYLVVGCFCLIIH